MKLDLLTKFLVAAALALCQLNTQAASQAPVAAEHGMVVTAQHLATHVGVDVLKDMASVLPLMMKYAMPVSPTPTLPRRERGRT